MPFIARFVDNHDIIMEEFTEFVFCDEGTSGRAIADQIIYEYRLDMRNIRGQCYNGAGNMAGRMNGAAGLSQGESDASKAQYFRSCFKTV